MNTTDPATDAARAARAALMGEAAIAEEAEAAAAEAGRWATDAEMAATTGRRRPPAVVGDLSLTLPDGSTLTASTDLQLAWQWAEAAHGPTEWAGMSYGEQCSSVADALAELRRAADDGETTTTTTDGARRAVSWSTT